MTKYAVIQGRRINLYNEYPENYHPLQGTLVEDFKYNILNNGILEASGDEVIWNITFHGFFDKDRKVERGNITKRWKSFLDFMNGVKTKYIKKGWYSLKERKNFKCVMSHYTIIEN